MTFCGSSAHVESPETAQHGVPALSGHGSLCMTKDNVFCRVCEVELIFSEDSETSGQRVDGLAFVSDDVVGE